MRSDKYNQGNGNSMKDPKNIDNQKNIEHAYECPVCEGEGKSFQIIPGHEDCGCHETISCEVCGGTGHLIESKVRDIIFEAAKQHGIQSGEPDHEVGDLQDIISKCLSVMNAVQINAIISNEEIKEQLFN